MGDLFRHGGHLIRVVGLFAAGVVAFLVLQAFMVPKGFGVHGHYRSGALDDNKARPLVHAGRAACLDCHSEVGEVLGRGKHATVGCEACHGPHAAHAADPSTAGAVRPDSRVLCARCHQASVARPAGFPQVEAAEHSGGEACASCHSPHSPLDGPATPVEAAAALAVPAPASPVAPAKGARP
jgi:predicted CXXCH cytochrome family protein